MLLRRLGTMIGTYRRRRLLQSDVLHFDEVLQASRHDPVALLQERLSSLVTHAYHTSPFHRERFREHAIEPGLPVAPANLSMLPILEKGELRDHLDSIRSRAYPTTQCVVAFTGGSTLAPTKFFRDRRCQRLREANRWWYYLKMNRRLEQHYAVVWGALQDLDMRMSIRAKLRSFLTMSPIVLPGNQITAVNVERFLARCIRERAAYLNGYSQAIYEVARVASECGHALPRFDSISVTAEPITPAQTALIRQVFDCPVYNVYGTRECGLIAAEVAGSSGMIVNPLNVFVEIVDQRGFPAPPGESGSVLVTDLLNYATPLIRYRIGDIGCWDDDGRHALFRQLRIIEGRETDVLQIGNRRISGATLTLISAPGVRAIQFVQSVPDHVTVNYVPDTDFNSESTNALNGRVLEVLGPHATITLNKIPAIECTSSGKYRYVISNLSRS